MFMAVSLFPGQMLGRWLRAGVRICAHSRILRRFQNTEHPRRRTLRRQREVAMKIDEICSSPVFVAYPDQALASAAREMRAHDVGALVVLAPGNGGQRPLGILTDRDIVLGQVRQCADLRCLTVGDVMTRDPLCIRADAELTEAIAMLASRGVRRAPVIDASGKLVGIITLDDLLPAIAQQLKELADMAVPKPGRRNSTTPGTARF
jgi:CBS domain-containing protein